MLARELITETRKEKGCISYAIFVITITYVA